jgi:hypothetical protein
MRFLPRSVWLAAFALTAPLVAGFSLLPSPISTSYGVQGAVRSSPEPLVGRAPAAAVVMARRMVATNAEAEAVAAAEAEAEMGQKRKKTKEVRNFHFWFVGLLEVWEDCDFFFASNELRTWFVTLDMCC